MFYHVADVVNTCPHKQHHDAGSMPKSRVFWEFIAYTLHFFLCLPTASC